jgi:UDP-N-acetylmuramate dehydrogenase
LSEFAHWQADVDLRPLNSFRVPARAHRFCAASSLPELRAALRDLLQEDAQPLILGGGSNLLLAADPAQPVLCPALRGIELETLDADRVELRAWAGEPWDGVVRAACAEGLWGIENLALIPGTAGAAPVQNIGAYGVELSDTLAWVDVIGLDSGEPLRLSADQLGLGYRDSRFKREPRRWLVTRIGLWLTSSAAPRLDYAGLKDALAGRAHGALSPSEVADTVRDIRRRKLPDPARLGNAGSFFKNPELDESRCAALQAAWPGLPVFPASAPGLRKLSAAWMIEQAGFKGIREGDAGVADTHALVLVNHGAASGAELLALARRVASGVEARFGVALEPEPVIIGADFREFS